MDLPQRQFTLTDSSVFTLDFLKSTGFIHVRRDQVSHKTFSGDTTEYERETVSKGHAVAALVVSNTDDKVLIIEQFRHAVTPEPWCFELPAGMIDEGELAEAAIIRELAEETGLEFNKEHDTIELLDRFYPSAGACNETMSLFLIETEIPDDLSGTVKNHSDEDIKLHVVSTDQLFAMAKEGYFVTGTILLAIEKLRSWLLSGALNAATEAVKAHQAEGEALQAAMRVLTGGEPDASA